MATQPISRVDLIKRVLLLDAMATRSLIRNYSATIRTIDELVRIACPLGDPQPDLFDLLADCWEDVHPTKGVQ